MTGGANGEGDGHMHPADTGGAGAFRSTAGRGGARRRVSGERLRRAVLPA